MRASRFVWIAVLVISPSFGAAAPSPHVAATESVDTHPGISSYDLSFALMRIARGDGTALAALAPLTSGAASLRFTDADLARVRDPPSLSTSILALAQAHPDAVDDRDVTAALLASATLPPDLARAISGLAQAALEAGALVARADPLRAAGLIEAALLHVRPTLEKHTIFLAYPDAYTGLAWREDETRQLVDDLGRARTPADVLRAAGIPGAAPPGGTPRSLSALLAEVYARADVPVDAGARAGLALADGADPALAGALASALQHVLIAWDLRDDAFASLTPPQRSALENEEAVRIATEAPAPTQEQLDLLAAYGQAVQALQEDAMRLAAAHLLAAQAKLQAAATDPWRHAPAAPCCTAPATEPSREREGVVLHAGSLSVHAGSSSDGSITLELSTGTGGSQASFANAWFTFDPRRGVLRVFDDMDRDHARGANERILLETPALARPERDILFADPYGFVVVTGFGGTLVDGSLGRRRVDVAIPSGAAAPGLPSREPALGQLDAAMRAAPREAAWPWLSEELRASLAPLDAEVGVERRTSVVVNPASQQMLHWDLGGDDTYETNAGGAGRDGFVDASPAPFPVALLLDEGGDDLYRTAAPHTIASANGSVALLVDRSGRDDYRHLAPSPAVAASRAGGLALLLDLGAGGGSYTARGDGIASARSAGVAVLFDEAGDERYEGGDNSTGASRLGALAFLLDAAGDDRYTGANFTLAASAGGVAAVVDASGNDTYVAAPRPHALGYAEPINGTAGPARLALLYDGGGRDKGACSGGSLANGALGRLALERTPLPSRYEPAYGACVEVDAGMPLAMVDATGVSGSHAAIPPSFFTSGFGNFSLPGLVRVGTLGSDLVPHPYVLSVDLLGSETYGVGALASTNATRIAEMAWELGYVSPVSIVLDLDGGNTFTKRAEAPGAFAWADGGVAFQAVVHAARVQLDADVDRVANLTRGPEPTRGAEAWQASAERNASAAAHARPVSGLNVFSDVDDGMASARGGGIALHVSDGYVTHALAPPRAGCRLACATTGGVALWLSSGGAGDIIDAGGGSLGAVHETELGGLAFYMHRGGRDNFTLASNRSMGVVLPAAPLGLPSTVTPSVALFIKDGWENDTYASNMTHPGLAMMPRRNNALWEDEPLETLGRLDDGRAMWVSRGIDNLDWYLNMNAASVDRGIAPQQGYGSPFNRNNAVGQATYETIGRNPATLAYLNTEGLTQSAGRIGAPIPGLTGDGGSTTGPYGVKPVTLARTALSPIVNVTEVKTAKTQGFRPAEVANVFDGTMEFRFTVRNPPAFAESTVAATQGTQPFVQDGRAIRRIEVIVVGTGPQWTSCPDPARADALEGGAGCIVAWWDRDVHAVEGGENMTRYNFTSLSADYAEWQASWRSTELLGDSFVRYLFPPGPYVITFRAFADRGDTIPDQRLFTPRVTLLETTWSDATNYTDDKYGYWGGAYHFPLNLTNPPALDAFADVVHPNATQDARVHVRTSEPGEVNVTIRPPRHVNNGRPFFLPTVPTRHADDDSAFALEGLDHVDVLWSPGSLPDGHYTMYLRLRSKASGEVSPEKSITLYVDRVAPATQLDPRGMPSVVNSDVVDQRTTFEVALLRDADAQAGVGAPGRVAHVWERVEVLDSMRLDVVVEERGWRYAGAVTCCTPREGNVDGATVKWDMLRIQGDPFPGAPRRISYAAYLEDMAGNVAVERPDTTPPAGPDCLGGRCAVVLYDISPPRTTLDLLEPVTGISRAAAATVTVDASETPDAAALRLFAAHMRAGDIARFDQALNGGEYDAPAPAATPNLTLARVGASRLVQHPEGLLSAGEPLRVRLNVSQVESDSARTFHEGRPVWVSTHVETLDGAQTGPRILHNVTAIYPYVEMLRGEVFTADLAGLRAPDASGVYRLVMSLELSRMHDPNVTNVSLSETFAVWERPPVEDARATFDSSAPSSHGDALYLLGRAVDHMGNVEAKVAYDLRVDLDLAPPSLEAPPRLEPLSGGALLSLRTDEVSRVKVLVHDEEGALVAELLAQSVDTFHDVLVDGLAPDTSYRLTLRLADPLGNNATIESIDGTPIGFRTLPAIDLRLAPLPAQVTAPTNVTWHVNVPQPSIVEYEVTLSLDGKTWEPLAETVTAYESGNATRTIRLDPTRHAEAAAARIRLEARLAERDDVRAIVETPAFLLDGRAPFIVMNGSRGISQHTRHAAAISIAAEDGGTGLAELEWSLDNKTWTGVNGSVTIAGDAPRVLHVRASDGAGNEGVAELRVLLDARPPTLEVAFPGDNVSRGGRIPVHVRVADAHAGVSRVSLRDDWGWSALLTPSEISRGQAAVLWPVGELEGSRRLTVNAVDAAGNVVTVERVALVDSIAPTLTALAPQAGIVSAVIGVTSHEPFRCAVRLAGPRDVRTLPCGGAPSPDALVVVDALRPGEPYVVTFSARDAAGNVARVEVPFRTLPDIEPPSRPAELQAEPLRTGALIVTWGASRDNAGVASYRVERDDGAGWRLVGVAHGTEFADPRTTPGKTYAYRVVAEDVVGLRSAPSASVEARARTAPVIENVRVVPEPGAVLVTFDLADADGDALLASVRMGDVVVEARPAAPGSSSWSARVEATTEYVELHVEATDAFFVVSDPLAGGYRVSVPEAASAGDGSFFGISAARRLVDAPTGVSLLACVAVLALVLSRRNP